MPDSPKKNSVGTAHKMKASKKSGSKKVKHSKDSKMGKQPSDDDDEMDLSKPLFPLQDYIGNRTELVEHLFKSVSRGNRLHSLLPDILKEIPFAKLKTLCVQQLEVMSKKRILHILSGQEMESSSGTDDSDIESTTANPQEPVSQIVDSDPAKQVADSTSVDAGEQNAIQSFNSGNLSVKVEENSSGQSPQNCDLLELHPNSADHVMLDTVQSAGVKCDSDACPTERLPIASTEDQSMPVVATSSITKTCMEILELELRARAIKSLINAQVPSTEVQGRPNQ